MALEPPQHRPPLCGWHRVKNNFPRLVIIRFRRPALATDLRRRRHAEYIIIFPLVEERPIHIFKEDAPAQPERQHQKRREHRHADRRQHQHVLPVLRVSPLQDVFESSII